MRTITLTALALLAMAGSTLAQKEPGEPAAPAKEPAAPATPPAVTPENVSYAIGTMIAGNLKQQGIKVDVAELTKGLNDVLEGKEPRLDKAQCEQLMAAYQKEQAGSESSRRTAEGKALYEKALAAGDKNAVASRDFLAANGKRKGVTTTASGLQYEVMKAGEGAKPKASDTVKVHYHGTLPDGAVFDSSVDRKEPISFPLLGVIPGWTEGVQLMPTGSKYKFSIPSWLSYGDGGSPPKIPGHSALVFEVELLSIE